MMNNLVRATDQLNEFQGANEMFPRVVLCDGRISNLFNPLQVVSKVEIKTTLTKCLRSYYETHLTEKYIIFKKSEILYYILKISFLDTIFFTF